MASIPVKLIAGIDEVGRGCIAGPVLAAAVILPDEFHLPGLTDSKKLTPSRRAVLSEAIKQTAIAWAIGRAEASEIDQINILQASLLAMRRAFDSLEVRPDWVRVDGNKLPELPCRGEAIVGGDLTHPEISAASILAKVARDLEMELLDTLYPGYDLAVHKGYPTPAHKAKLAELGPTPFHRFSFGPVAQCRTTCQIPLFHEPYYDGNS